jgi:signal transduction histidine kinase
MYLENIAKMREEQFTESVMRALNSTSEFMERQETLHFLEEDVNIIESGFYSNYNDNSNSNTDLQYSVENQDGSVTKYTLSSEVETAATKLSYPPATQSVEEKYSAMQEVIRSQYLYQKGLLTEVILSILRDSGSRPVTERADSTVVKNCLTTELANNGLTVPFEFAVYNNNKEVYSTEKFNHKDPDSYTIPLFANTEAPLRLDVEFPTKDSYIFSSVKFIIPSLAFTLILLVVFLYTVILAFRQKKLTEMKTDFINNMTHELKTPISTISLAGQMLTDPSVGKSEGTMKQLSNVIVEESKRLRFQVEKVLQLSVFDNTVSTLKFTDVEANTIIAAVVKTFKLKVEKLGGTLTTDLQADKDMVYVDEMQFTNVIFNLLDNALKYMRTEVEPQLTIRTKNTDNNRIEIKVIDNGIGIKKDDIKHIFEKFYRVSTGNLHDVKGFGLGLAYVKKMIQEFHGNISVESTPGSGSTFIIVLPLSDR